MHRYAVIHEESRVVVNVIKWDGQTPWSPPSGHRAVRNDTAFIGSLYDESTNTFSIPVAQSEE